MKRILLFATFLGSDAAKLQQGQVAMRAGDDCDGECDETDQKCLEDCKEASKYSGIVDSDKAVGAKKSVQVTAMEKGTDGDEGDDDTCDCANDDDCECDENNGAKVDGAAPAKNKGDDCDCKKGDDCDCNVLDSKKGDDNNVALTKSGSAEEDKSKLFMKQTRTKKEETTDASTTTSAKKTSTDAKKTGSGKKTRVIVPGKMPSSKAAKSPEAKKKSDDTKAAVDVTKSAASALASTLADAKAMVTHLVEPAPGDMLNNSPPAKEPTGPAVAQPVPTTAPVMGSGSGSQPVPAASVPINPLEQKCNEIHGRVERLRQEIALWSDHATWNAKIAADKAALQAETTVALANMLAATRYELHQLTVPVFVEVLTEKLELLLKDHEQCLRELEASKAQSGTLQTVEEEVGAVGKRISWPIMVILFLTGVIIAGGTYLVTRRQRPAGNERRN